MEAGQEIEYGAVALYEGWPYIVFTDEMVDGRRMIVLELDALQARKAGIQLKSVPAEEAMIVKDPFIIKRTRKRYGMA